MKKYLPILLLLFAIPVSATTRTAATCQGSAVNTTIGQSSPGDTVIVPAGTSCDWTVGVSFSGITVKGAGKSATTGTVVTGGMATLTKHATQLTFLDGFRFTANDTHFTVNGAASSRMAVIGDSYFANNNSGTVAAINANGVLIFNSDFVVSAGEGAPGADILPLHPNEDWSQPPTFGINDVQGPVGGERNIYFEDDTFTNVFETAPDSDEGARFVTRHNTYTDSSIVFHGGTDLIPENDSSAYGHRHYEIYNNIFSRSDINQDINKWIWSRGGTGVIANNQMDLAASSQYPGKPEIRLGIGCDGSPSTYPIPFQQGQSSYPPTVNPPTLPVLIFGNTAGPHSNGPGDSNFISITENATGSPVLSWTQCSNPTSYVQLNRDYYLSNQWGWTPLAYPHPVRALLNSTAIPGFVSESGKNSTLTVALGASGGGGFIPTSTCASYSYCLPFAESTPAGNFGIAAFQYANGTAVTSTATDDHSNTWTCIGSSAASSSKMLNLCYAPNLAAGTRKVTIGFGTTAVTQVQADVAQFYNIAVSSPLVTSNSVVGTSSTTMTGPTLTTSANDLVYAMFCRTGTPLMTSGSFTPGSGFTLGLTKYQDGCATEWQVSTGGSVTPTMTMGSASTYIVYAADFAASASAQGSAPTAPYLQRVMSWSSQSNISNSSFKFQFPNSAGDLLAMTGAGAVNYLGNSITDSGTNTWTLAGQCQQSGTCSGSGGYSYEFYKVGAAANTTNTQTVNFTGSGDTTVFFYDFVGSFTYNSRSQQSSSANTTNLLPATAFSVNPGATNALTIAIGPIAFNTAVSVAQPSSNATNYFDGGWFGGETIDGGGTPESIIDQNNIFSHTYTSTSGAKSWQWNTAVSSSEQNNVGVDFISFTVNASGTVSLAPASQNFGSVNVNSSSSPTTFTLTNNSSSSATSVVTSITGTNAGDFTKGSDTCNGSSVSASGGTCSLTVTFSPTASGSRSATLSISYSGADGASPKTAALSGIGIVAVTTPTFIPSSGTSATPIVVTVSTTAGTVICHGTTNPPVTNGIGTGCSTGTAITTNSGTNCVASSTVCGDFTVTTSQTQYAVAGLNAQSDSSVASAVYTINPPAVAPGATIFAGIAILKGEVIVP